MDLTTKFPFGHEGESPEFTLHTCVNGGIEASQMLARLELTPEINLHRLEKTGMLAVKENHQTTE